MIRKTAVLALCATIPLALGACRGKPTEPAATATAIDDVQNGAMTGPAMTGAPETAAVTDVPTAAPAGYALTGSRIILPAVKGSPGVAYFQVSVPEATTITEVKVSGVGHAELMDTTHAGDMNSMKPVEKVEVTPGAPNFFTTGGRHVMLHDIDDDLHPGEQTGITIVFANGVKLTRPAMILSAGDRH